MHLNLTAASTALFSTWVFVENLGILFDPGDGVSATLGQKGRKIRHVFITHADRDHVCGLLQLHQLNAANGSPHIYNPKNCGSFPALRDLMGYSFCVIGGRLP
jgi:ribonuclease Z